MRVTWIAVALTGCASHVAPAPAPSALEQALARWDVDPDGHADLDAVVVRRHGAIVAERYYHGSGPDTLHDIRSAGKSVTALLVGIAIDQGRIGGVGDPVRRYLPDRAGDATLADVLTMRSGLDSLDSDPATPGNEDRLDAADDPFAFAMAVPMRDRPGTRYAYNSLTAYLAGLIVERAVGRPLDDFAKDALFAPLGITAWTWRRDRAGHTTGEGNLSVTARELSVLGQLVLDRGVYGGRRVVAAAWIDAMTAPQVAIAGVDPYADSYGYFWYRTTQMIGGAPVAVVFASGNGGNKIYVVPSEDVVVAITSSAYNQRWGQPRSQQILRDVLAALR